MTSFHVSFSGLSSALTRLDLGADNIANALTPGYRARRGEQVDVRGGGAAIAGVSVDVRPGPVEIGDGGFQLAILGDGYFRVATPQGDRFLRAGSFHVDGQGRMVTADGFPLEPPLQLPAGATGFRVGAQGDVTATGPDGAPIPLGQIQLARFANPSGLVSAGDNLHAAGPASGPPIPGLPGAGPFGSLLFGAVEGSNVDLTREIVDQIVLKAVAKANLAAIRAQDEMLGRMVDLRG